MPLKNLHRPGVTSILAIGVIAILSTTRAYVIPTYNLISSPGVRVTPGIIPAPELSGETLAHRAVVENAAAEAQLPPELLNPFYKNPAIASALAKESWFTNKEFPIKHREAEKIPRSEIFKIIERAGFLNQHH